jgi:hypothetical protein
MGICTDCEHNSKHTNNCLLLRCYKLNLNITITIQENELTQLNKGETIAKTINHNKNDYIIHIQKKKH